MNVYEEAKKRQPNMLLPIRFLRANVSNSDSSHSGIFLRTSRFARIVRVPTLRFPLHVVLVGWQSRCRGPTPHPV